MILGQVNLKACGHRASVEELAADKGCHDNRLLTPCRQWEARTCIPERKQKTRCWTDKPAADQAAFRGNRRRVRGDKGKRLNRWGSEWCERTFAPVCETGGGRRNWLRGLKNVTKAHVLKSAAYNLGLLLRKVWGLRKPRNWEGAAALIFSSIRSLLPLAAVMKAATTDRFEQSDWYPLLLLIVAAVGYAIRQLPSRHHKNGLF